jgi:hypothetical protein
VVSQQATSEADLLHDPSQLSATVIKRLSSHTGSHGPEIRMSEADDTQRRRAYWTEWLKFRPMHKR